MISQEPIIPIQFEKLVQSATYGCMVFQSQEKRFGVFISPEAGRLLQQYVTQHTKTRPMTHEWIRSMFQGMDIEVRSVILHRIENEIFYGLLLLEQKIAHISHLLEVDSRPSDAIMLALLHRSPIYCTPNVLESSQPYCD